MKSIVNDRVDDRTLDHRKNNVTLYGHTSTQSDYF